MSILRSTTIISLILSTSCSSPTTQDSGKSSSEVVQKEDTKDTAINGPAIMTTEVRGTEKNQKKTKAFSIVTDDYFEVGLFVNSKMKYHVAQKDIISPTSIEDFHMKFFQVVDPTTPDTAQIEFTDPTEFLNYMSKHGYDMADQKKEKYRIDYTFKRKP